MVREQEERLAVGAAEDQLQGAFGHIELSDPPALRRVDEDLAEDGGDTRKTISQPEAGEPSSERRTL